MSTFIFMIILFTMFGDETTWGEDKGTHMCTSSEKHMGHPVSRLLKLQNYYYGEKSMKELGYW